jgi:mRNA interferase RelE/StbE
LRWTIRVEASARRDLDRVPEKVFPAIFEAIHLLEEHPHRVGKPLRGEADGTWSLRRGEFRVLYRLDSEDQTVHVVAIGHRRDIYRPER